ncbi:metallophosphoesterase [Sphingosinicellaceae bacterium]|nr:metallophosphoesterase [Sphingosinicellaceae bacterium]
MTRIFHVSDVHFGTEDRDALLWFAATVAAERPDLVLLTGDLTASARRSEFAACCDWLDSLLVPIRVEPGNHDLPVYRPLLRLLDPYARMRAVIARYHKPLELSDVTLVSLKTTARVQLRRNWSLGRVGSTTLAAALAGLKQRDPAKLALVTCHHPLIDQGTRSSGRTRGGAAALEVLAAAGADAVCTGHVHDPFDRLWEGGARPVRLIGAGTLSERTRATRPSFNLLTVAGRELEVTVRAMA